ncbi:hypothetical protein [Oscillibacter sp.]|uniref:hypothetical protein n=1 Tax=Oscillibacter sp. TaxID=1945593 RepID=UPI002896B834|nr:hypothetical protein [Oscillibacter sp.]
MYSKITNLAIDIYDPDTGQFVVTLTLEPPYNQERKLLNFLNHGERLSDLLFLNAEVIKTQEGYVPPTIEDPKRRVEVLHLLAQDDTGTYVPIDIRMLLTAQVRHINPNDPRHLGSIEYTDIVLESVSRPI